MSWEQKTVLFSPCGVCVGIAKEDKMEIFCRGQSTFSVSRGTVAVSDKGSVIVKNPGSRWAYLFLPSGERFIIPSRDDCSYLAYCFAVENAGYKGEVQCKSIGDENIIIAPGKYAEHRPPFLLVEDGNFCTVYHEEWGKWRIPGPVGVGKAIFYARMGDIYLFVPPVGIYYGSLPRPVRKIKVGETMVAALCDDNTVYAFPAVSVLPAHFVRVAEDIADMHWEYGKDNLVCVTWDEKIVTHSFPPQAEPDFYVPEEMAVWGIKTDGE